MPTQKAWPILIVGAGPTGLSLAIECCRHRVPFRLIDQNLEPSPYSKALALWHGTMQMLQAQGMLSDFIKASVTVHRVCFADRGRPVAVLNPHAYSFGDLKGPIVLPQCATEGILSAELTRLGGQIERGVSLTEFTEMDTYLKARLHHSDNKTETAQFSYLAGCDGARSITRKTLEQQHAALFVGYTETAIFILGDFEYDGAYDNQQIMISWSGKATIALFPVSPKIVRIIAERKDGIEIPPTLAEFQALIHAHGPWALQLKNPSWLSIFKINERLSTHYQKGRVFLLGDAAHIHSPAGGQGMNTGMQDAFNLGWKLPFILKSPNNLGLIQSYEAERRAIGEKVVTEASRKLHFGMTQNPVLRVIKNLILPIVTRIKPLQAKIIAELSELFIEYPHSALIIPNNTLPKAMRPGKKYLSSAVNNSHRLGQDHVLILFASTAAELKTAKAKAELIIKNLSTEIVGIVAKNERPHWYLIRPDQFIAAGGPLVSFSALESYCQVLLS